jgi:CheY-like chemotaxis protein
MITKVLIVDDSLVERLLVESLLARDGSFQVELAESGQQALEKIAEAPPDVVVTDLVMPDINGVELVRVIRRQYDRIPVVLMTAYGDESVAVEALEAGAASYVPKAQKAERLVETVRRVAELAAADRYRERLCQCIFEYECHFALENDRHLIQELVRHAQQAMAGVGFGDTVERVRVGEALEEALLHAMYHGNLEISEQELARVRAELDEVLLERLLEERLRDPCIRQRKIIAIVRLTSAQVTFVVRDQGRGFEGHGLDRFEAERDDAPESFEAGRHRGLMLIHSLMDEVVYNVNDVTMVKHAVRPVALSG